MSPRPPAQQARLEALLAAGWMIADEYPLLHLITLVRPTHGDGVTRYEHLTLARSGKTTLENRP